MKEEQDEKYTFIARGDGAIGSGFGVFLYAFDDYNMAFAFTKMAMMRVNPATNDFFPISWDVYPCPVEPSVESALAAFDCACNDNEEEDCEG